MKTIWQRQANRANLIAVVAVAAWLVGASCVWAQVAPQPAVPPAAGPAVPSDLTDADGQPPSAAPRGLIAILSAGGPVGMLIILLSIAAVALIIEHIITIRESVLVPPGMGAEVRQLLDGGKLKPADERCRMQPSFLAYVLRAGFAEVDGGWPAVEKAMEDATAEQSARLFRKIEYLSVIGNIAPMMGLLGTVVGMIFAFRELADSQGAPRAADLAEGIYLALITTVEGLIVAIPSLAAFAVFRNRVDHLVAEVAYAAQHAAAPLKRLRPNRPPPSAPPVERGR